MKSFLDWLYAGAEPMGNWNELAPRAERGPRQPPQVGGLS